MQDVTVCKCTIQSTEALRDEWGFLFFCWSIFLVTFFLNCWFSWGIFSRETKCNETFARIISLILLILSLNKSRNNGWKMWMKNIFWEKRTFFFPLQNFVNENVWNRVKIGFSEKDFLTKISCHFFPKDFFLSFFFFHLWKHVKNFRRKKKCFSCAKPSDKKKCLDILFNC